MSAYKGCNGKSYQKMFNYREEEVGHALSNELYRVAQNKIPHQTICNISATSGQILKFLEAA